MTTFVLKHYIFLAPHFRWNIRNTTPDPHSTQSTRHAPYSKQSNVTVNPLPAEDTVTPSSTKTAKNGLQDPSTVADLDGEKTVSDAGATKVSMGSRFGEQGLPPFFDAKKWGSSQRPFS